MMEISDPRLRSLLRQAKRVAAAGKRAAAESLYRQVIEEAPEVEAAWLGLAGVLVDEAEKKAAYQRVLEINPNNEAAQVALNPRPPNPGVPADDWVKEVLDKPKMETAVPEPEPEPEPEPKPVATAVPQPAPTAREFDMVCYRHPNRETSLRCYTCNKPICTECAVKTPVGYSCPDCLRDLRKGYYTATAVDYVVAFLVTLPLSIVAAYLVGFLGFFVFFVAPVVGSLIGRIAFWAVRRRRGRYLSYLVGATVVLGALIKLAGPFIVSVVFALLLSPEQLQALLTSGNTLVGLLLRGGGSLIWTGLYAFLAAGAAYYFVKV
jgi:hypothetical protein